MVNSNHNHGRVTLGLYCSQDIIPQWLEIAIFAHCSGETFNNVVLYTNKKVYSVRYNFVDDITGPSSTYV